MHGTGHKALSIDLEKTQEVAEAVAVLKAERASILINNAGGPPGSPLMENSIEDMRRHSRGICMHRICLFRASPQSWSRLNSEGS